MFHGEKFWLGLPSSTTQKLSLITSAAKNKRHALATCSLKWDFFFARATATSICHQSSSTITCLVKKIENSSHLRPMQRRELIPGGSRAQCAKR